MTNLGEPSTEAGVISIIPVTNGTFNLFGTRGESFVLQGSLTAQEMEELLQKGQVAMKVRKVCRNCGAPAGEPCDHDGGCIDADRRG